jgi:hypothetical protein
VKGNTLLWFAAVIDVIGVVQDVQPLGEITVKSGPNAGNSKYHHSSIPYESM